MAAVGPQRAGRLAIVAGNGHLPVHLAQAARDGGREPFVIELDGESSGRFPSFDHGHVSIGDIAGLNRLLQKAGISEVVLSGGVRRRPQLSEIRPSLAMVLSLPSLVRTLFSGGDDAVLKMVIRLIEAEGPKVIGAQDVAPDLLATLGPLGSVRPGDTDLTDIDRAGAAALALGALDIGQGAICVRGRVVALEGPEGTDQMMARVADLRQQGRISRRRKGVLVKLSKPQQDTRADLPSIGPMSVENAHAAGLAGIAVEAGRSLVLERETVIETANRLGLFVCGIDRGLEGRWM